MPGKWKFGTGVMGVTELSDPEEKKKRERRKVKDQLDRLELESEWHAHEFYETARKLAEKRKVYYVA